MEWKILWVIYMGVCLMIFIYSASALQENPSEEINLMYYSAVEIEKIIVRDYGVVPNWEEIKLIKAVARRVSESHEYKLDYFDCTDFSKKLVRELRKEKIKAQCSAGYYLGETNYPEHTWVSVFVGDLRIEVEATGGYIIKDEDYESYEVKWEDLCW